MSTIAAGNTLTTGFVASSDTTGNLVLSATGTVQIQQNGTTLPALSVAPMFSATCSAGTSLTTATYTKLGFNTIVYDTNNNFSTSNNRFTPTVAGYYQFNAAFFVGTNTSTRPIISLYKNGSALAQGLNAGSSLTGGINYQVSYMAYANGSTDYFEIYGYQDSGGTVTTNSSSAVTWFQGFLARGA